MLAGKRCRLEPILSLHDESAQHLKLLNDPEVTRYLGIGRFPETEERNRRYLQRFMDSDTCLIFKIVANESDSHIGNVTLNEIRWIHRTADTSIVLWEKSFWGKGYATEAWRLLLNYAFRSLGLRKITACLVEGNLGSQKTLEKLGFKQEGRLRKQWLLDGEWRDVLKYGILVDEYDLAARPW